MKNGRVVLYICMSIDGFIATKDDDISWLSFVDREGEDYGYSSFAKTVEYYIVGRKTYDKVISMVNEFPPAKQFDCYVMSRTRSGKENGVTFYNEDISTLVTELKSKSEKNIYCDGGGGEVVKLLMDRQLIDEYIISIIPTVLGDGKRLFLGETLPEMIRLTDVTKYESGLVQLRYVRA